MSEQASDELVKACKIMRKAVNEQRVPDFDGMSDEMIAAVSEVNGWDKMTEAELDEVIEELGG